MQHEVFFSLAKNVALLILGCARHLHLNVHSGLSILMVRFVSYFEWYCPSCKAIEYGLCVDHRTTGILHILSNPICYMLTLLELHPTQFHMQRLV